MPTAESTSPDDRDREREIERGERPDRGGTKQKSSTATSSKTSKDLSHVPCKFYKVGGCTAGASCPFSHHLPEPGQKETCAWFVKGNCKFGHKCALAHILPGQSMSMDRKNKKAAQIAAQGAGGNERGERSERGKEGKSGRGGATKREGHTTGSGSTGNRNPLLTGGSTAPTRLASSTPTGRPPMSLKTALSPPAPAPPVASFGVLDDLEGDGVQLATAPAQGKQPSQDSATSATPPESAQQQSKPKSPEPLPTSAPRSAATPTKAQDFGPIGSPPASGSRPSVNGTSALSPGPSPKRVNGINAAAEGEAGFFSSSPFSAPGAQSVFLSGSYTGGGGVAASLGSGLAMMGGRTGWGGERVGGGMASSSVKQGSGFDFEDFGAKKSALLAGRSVSVSVKAPDVAVEDEELEDFLPSSLTDLLTPEERSRRMSRSNSGQQPASALSGFGSGELGGGTGTAGASSGLSTGGHRYSRSVPAPSLLGDIKSIWSENKGTPLPSSPPTHKGTPSQSFISRFDGHGEDALSMSIGSPGSGMMGLSPSNASAAFLPGLHSHYLNAKAKQAQAQQLGLGGLGRGTRGVSNPMYGGTNSGLGNSYLLGGNAGVSSSPGSQVHTHTDARTNTQHTYRTTPSPFDLTQQQHLHLQQPHTARPIPSNGNNNGGGGGDDGPHVLSPGARALQAHAPGQSLPQGLAAGYSRIHALPPLSSPGSGSVFGSGTPPTTEVGVPSSGPYGGWKPSQAAAAATSPPSNAGGLEAMFSRLSYSAAAAASAKTGTNVQQSGTGLAPPPGLTRNVSGGRFGNSSTPLSPLSGPVVNRDDDDDLFSMDG